jgi:hypothetical protein
MPDGLTVAGPENLRGLHRRLCLCAGISLRHLLPARAYAAPLVRCTQERENISPSIVRGATAACRPSHANGNSDRQNQAQHREPNIDLRKAQHDVAFRLRQEQQSQRDEKERYDCPRPPLNPTVWRLLGHSVYLCSPAAANPHVNAIQTEPRLDADPS